MCKKPEHALSLCDEIKSNSSSLEKTLLVQFEFNARNYCGALPFMLILPFSLALPNIFHWQVNDMS